MSTVSHPFLKEFIRQMYFQWLLFDGSTRSYNASFKTWFEVKFPEIPREHFLIGCKLAFSR